MPNLVGKKYDEAEKILKKNGYKLGIVKEVTSTEPAGTILKQDPEGGVEADKGTKINITVSDGKGKEKGTVPTLTGKTLEQAKSAIASAGFQVGNISYNNSDIYGSGYVMYQQYSAGSSLDKGTTIDIEVSKGKESSDGSTNGNIER